MDDGFFGLREGGGNLEILGMLFLGIEGIVSKVDGWCAISKYLNDKTSCVKNWNELL